jgi:hypothetical protein
MTETHVTPTAETSLRRVLLLDAASCAVLGIGFLALASVLADPLGAPTTFLRVVGAVLAVCAVVIGGVARGRPVQPAAVAAVVVLNAAWVVGSLTLAAGAWTSLSTAGIVLDVVQAAAVLGLAAAEAVGLRRLAPSGAGSPNLAR